MVVCESVPTQVSGYALPSRVITTRARYSMFTWCTMPVPGGTTLNWRSASWPQRRNWNRSWFALKLDLHVPGERVRAAEHVGHHRVVND